MRRDVSVSFSLGLPSRLKKPPGSCRGVGLLDVVDGQRKEVLAGLRGLRRDDGREDDGVLDGDDHRSAGLTRDLAGLERDCVIAVLEVLRNLVEHVHSLWPTARFARPDRSRWIGAPRLVG